MGETEGSDRSDIDLEWQRRTLCTDEACIGVIGPDGRCKECGRPGPDDSPVPPMTAAADDFTSPEEAQPPADPEAVTGEGDGDRDEEWERRTLCSDEACIGVIGPDGRCKECGRAADDPPSQQ